MPPKKKAESVETRVRRARSVGTRAINKAAIVAADVKRNRSTRTRESYKIRAEACDRMVRVLAGKE